MPIEIERRFLIDAECLEQTWLSALEFKEISQIYLPRGEIEFDEIVSGIKISGHTIVMNIDAEEWMDLLQILSDDKLGIRLRIIEDLAFLTIKGNTIDGARPEFEWPVDPVLVKQFFEHKSWPDIRKVRHYWPNDDIIWEIDVFTGRHTGIIIAEVELEQIEHPLTLPGWVSEEITNQDDWSNAALASNPVYT